jgi:hypothetical protein
MKRLGAILVFAGAVLVSTHILAPAETPPAKPAVIAADLAAIDQARPIVDEVNAQVDRMRERLASPPAYPAPTRDPFRFGKRADPAPPKPAAPAPAPVFSESTPAPPVLPRLIAIALTTTEGVAQRTAALALGDDLRIVKPGETMARFVVHSIGADVVELIDPLTGATYRVSLN